jgi:hypothetical protein
MKIEDFLALPGTQCIRIRVGPEMYDEVEISQDYFDAHKEELLDFCQSLGDVTAFNWRSMKQHTGGNGMMAKILIALGDLAGAWKMHPPLENSFGMWNRDHPRVFQMMVAPASVPKPSAGDLDTDQACFCCERQMGPSDSSVHDLVASQEEPKLCLECALEGCELEQGPCHVFPDKVAGERKERPSMMPSEDGGPPPGLDAYLSQFE